MAMLYINLGQYIFIGYTIPAGWTIMLANSAQQLNPNTFKDPLQFNPWRWKIVSIFIRENLVVANMAM
ncbi:hypothetical protein LguiB_002009 [Lonicera macranthoides]